MAAQRGRPRDPRIAGLILKAAVDELADVGIAGFSTNRVAARAGVDKRGLHTRWPDRDELIVAALGTLAAGLVPPRTGSLADDLAALAPAVAAVLTASRLQILQRCVAEARQYPAISEGFRRDSVDRCAAVIEDAFQQARTRGETTADPARSAESFLGMMLTRATLLDGGAVLGESQQQAIIEFSVAAAGSSSSARGVRAAPPEPA